MPIRCISRRSPSSREVRREKTSPAGARTGSWAGFHGFPRQSVALPAKKRKFEPQMDADERGWKKRSNARNHSSYSPDSPDSRCLSIFGLKNRKWSAFILNAGCGGHPVRRRCMMLGHAPHLRFGRQDVGPTQSIEYRRSLFFRQPFPSPEAGGTGCAADCSNRKLPTRFSPASSFHE